GLAIGDSACQSFVRHSAAPILDRADEGLFIRAVHSVCHEGGVWRAWYSAGRAWQMIGELPYPCYEIRYAESADGVHFPSQGISCLAPQGREYRIGRPRVFSEPDGYGMYFTRGDRDGNYTSGYARSSDGRIWRRHDEAIGISPSQEGWDSRALCYATPITVGRKRYLFYNGNDMGRDGFGYAEEMSPN
ncbi:MAG: hypothetical protein WA418_37840, partial [Bradyrhizobium sp.]